MIFHTTRRTQVLKSEPIGGAMKKLVSLLIFALVSLTLAQDDSVVISPQSIVVNPIPSFEVETWVDKDTSGSGYPSYTIGESIRIGVRVSEDAYVYLFNVRSNGEVTQILPNRLDDSGRSNRLSAGQTRYFPPQGAHYTFDIAGPAGLDKVIAVASKEPLDTSILARFDSEGDFASSQTSEDSFAQTLSIVVTPIDQADWVTDTALFNVVRSGQAAPAPSFGTLVIRSEPSGARAFVDGRYVGRTPVRYGTRRGEHTIRVELEGYGTFESGVSLQGGGTTEVTASLRQTQRYGSLFVRANVGGADVYIDGSRVGAIGNGTGEFRMDGLTPGGHTLRVSAPGFSTVERPFEVRVGETVRLELARPALHSVATCS